WHRAVKHARAHLREIPTSNSDRLVLADLLRMGHNMDVPIVGEECLGILNGILKAEPENAEAHYVLATFLVTASAEAAPFAEEHFLAAERFAKPAVNPDAYQGLGFACLYQKKNSEAIAHFEKYLTLVADAPNIRDLLNQLKAGKEGKVIFKPLA